MVFKNIYSIFLMTFLVSFMQGQSFYLTTDNKKILDSEVKNGISTIFGSDSGIKLKKDNSTISYDNLLGKYDFDVDVFYYLKKFKTKELFKKEKILDYLLMDKMTIGEIKMYFGYITDAGSNQSSPVWLVEEGAEEDKVHEEGLIRSKKQLLNKLLEISKDKPFLHQELSKPDLLKSIDNLVRLVREYNLKAYLKSAKETTGILNGKVLFYRDAIKQNKSSVQFTINGKAFMLDKKEKIEVMLPTNMISLVEITNDTDTNRILINPTKHFTKYYEVELNKKFEGSLSKRNQNNSFVQTRLRTIKLIKNE